MATTSVQSLPPIADENARLLILGSMPGVASLGAGEYYAHPRNAFWPIMGELFGASPDLSYEERCARLRAAGVAVWDVLQECRREGSLDSAIEGESERANDCVGLFARCRRITRVFFNGRKAEATWLRHVAPSFDDALARRLPLIRLPSTSPAYAGLSLEEKLAMWRETLCRTRQP